MKTIQSVCNATQSSLPLKAYYIKYKTSYFLFLINITHFSSFAQINFSLYCRKPRCKRYDCCFHSSRYSSQTSTRKRGQTNASGGVCNATQHSLPLKAYYFKYKTSCFFIFNQYYALKLFRAN